VVGRNAPARPFGIETLFVNSQRPPAPRFVLAVRFAVVCPLVLGVLMLAVLGRPTAVTAAEKIAYETRIEGVAQKRVRTLLRQTSQLVTLTEQPPATVAGLRRRANDDRDRLRRALRSEGFYSAAVAVRIDTETDPVTVTLDVDTGPIYVLAETRVVYTGDIPADAPAVPRDIADIEGLSAGMDARAPRIVAAQNRILARLRRNGFPDPAVAERQAVVNHDDRTLAVTWRIDPGPYAVFGGMRVEGLESVARDYVTEFRTWEPGTPYDQQAVAETRKALMNTNLFAGIGVKRPGPEDGRQPLVFEVTEREHRSVGFTARFSTSEGPSASAFWEHRNAFGHNETVRFSADVGFINQRARGEYREPRFLREDQKLISSLTLRRQDSDAFTERAVASEVDVERQLDAAWTARLGGALELTETEDNEGTRTFLLGGVPGRLVYDTRDSRLNPTQGARVALDATPYVFTVDDTSSFLRSEANATHYIALTESERFVLAGRGRIGSILGPETETIPASKRFYAGGGGSLRGFDFQSVGPLDSENDPLGGRSVIEASLEARWRVTESIGVVPFVDAGNVYDSPVPGVQTGEDARIRASAGLGLRYHTAIGPVRLDIARALDQRDVDDIFELYISFGQAF